MSKQSFSLLNTHNIPQQGHRSTWQVHSLAEKALAISSYAQQVSHLTLYLAKDSQEANEILDTLKFFVSDEVAILEFPEWETLPYDQFSPHQDIISQRLKTLYQLPNTQQGILILPIATLVQKLVPLHFIKQHTFLLTSGDSIELDGFLKQLEASGYQRVNQVYEHGDFAVRGALIDVFPMGSQNPFRLDLFDNEIETIRSFDAETQRTIKKMESIELLPAKEYDLNVKGVERFRQNFRTEFGEDARKAILYQAVSDGQTADGLEYYLPLFHETTQSIIEYLPKNTLIFDGGNVALPINQAWLDYQERYNIGKHNPDYPILAPEKLIFSEVDILTRLKKFHRITLELDPEKLALAKKVITLSTKPLPDVSLQNNSDYPLAKLNAFLDHYTGKVLFCAETAGRRETLIGLLNKQKFKLQHIDNWKDFLSSLKKIKNYKVIVGSVENSIFTPDFCIISENQILGKAVIQKRRRKRKHTDFDTSVSNLIELELDHPIVHIDHGVGRYLGLEKMTIQNEESEFLVIRYANDDKLFVPVTSIHLISRYTGSNPETAPIHKLGSDRWEKAKKKAIEKVHDVAAELLDVYAQRESQPGYAFEKNEEAYARFKAGFPFEETPDQETTIHAVLQDLYAAKPMDRLVCGDVGFGKTEVAMRAAFVAAYSGKQVAVLVPTTLLSQQHLESFRSRFADWPIKIAGLSRFQTSKEQTKILADIKNNQVDIVIGTHKLIQKDMRFGNIGLIIIDEEHRFGVRQKEQLKKMRTEIDVLTMTATPIPRTLNMAMNDLRDLSIIATPPAKRLPVQTFVQEWNPELVREACLREIRRGGQIYLLFNNVQKIDAMVEEMEALLPEAKIAAAHGQMHEKELEQIMENFYHRKFQILVCTTIIETGIDIPTANTILIHRADKFGLAQLHQLRGRVGRSHHKAYAYLFTPAKILLTKDAEKRLTAISKHDTLGAGFMLASHDLEIRGAGELLGDGQSGQIQEIGFGLYSELLDRAVKSLKSGKRPELSTSLHQGCEVDIGSPALIPSDYLPDIHTRLVFYKRIASASNKHELRELEVEMIDRFGLLPNQSKNLFAVTQIKLLIEPLNLKKLDANDSMIRIQFGSNPNLNTLELIKLIQDQPKHYQLKGQTELKFFDTMPSIEARIHAIDTIIKKIKAN